MTKQNFHEKFEENQFELNISNRRFGLSLACVLIFFQIIKFFKHQKILPVYIVAIILLSLISLLKPNWLSGLKKIWIAFSHLMKKITTRVALALIFYLVIGPIGLILKINKKDILKLKKNNNNQSYWIEVTNQNSSFNNQF